MKTKGILLVAAAMLAVQSSQADPSKAKVSPSPAKAAQCNARQQVSAKRKDKVKLELKLPKPLFDGTPKDMKTANLERPRIGKRQAFYVPIGTKNIARDREVISSDSAPIIGTLDLVTDGEKEGYDGCFVELGSGVQWVQIDLRGSFNIHTIAIWHFHSEACIYRDVIVKAADDEDLISNVKTIFNNDHDNSAGLGIGKDKEYIETYKGRIIDAKGVEASYLRFYSNGSTSSESNHYIEIEVYGTPVKKTKK